MNDQLARNYLQHRQGLFSVALAITRCRADAEDAVQEVFSRLCRNGATDKPAGYLFAAVRNAAADRLRARRPGQTAEMLLAPCLPNGQHPAAQRERDHAVAAALDALPQELRTPVFLRIFAGLNFRQIAELTDTPLQTIVSRYAAGLRRLRPDLRKWL